MDAPSEDRHPPVLPGFALALWTFGQAALTVELPKRKLRRPKLKVVEGGAASTPDERPNVPRAA